jgi:hypothetical protein
MKGDSTMFPRPPFHYEPLILIVVGLFSYLFTRSRPLSEETQSELESKGYDIFRYSPATGLTVMFLGIIATLAINWDFFFWKG